MTTIPSARMWWFIKLLEEGRVVQSARQARLEAGTSCLQVIRSLQHLQQAHRMSDPSISKRGDGHCPPHPHIPTSGKP